MKQHKIISLFIIFVAGYFISKAQQTDSLTQQLDTLIAERYPSIAPGCVVLVAKRIQLFMRKHLVLPI